MHDLRHLFACMQSRNGRHPLWFAMLFRWNLLDDLPQSGKAGFITVGFSVASGGQ